MGKPAFVSPKEYAAFRGVHWTTVIRWIKAQRLPAEQPAGKKGRYAIPVEMMEKTMFPPSPEWPERPL
jgi:predicted site-specific integrase-resolvase